MCLRRRRRRQRWPSITCTAARCEGWAPPPRRRCRDPSEACRCLWGRWWRCSPTLRRASACSRRSCPRPPPSRSRSARRWWCAGRTSRLARSSWTARSSSTYRRAARCASTRSRWPTRGGTSSSSPTTSRPRRRSSRPFEASARCSTTRAPSRSPLASRSSSTAAPRTSRWRKCTRAAQTRTCGRKTCRSRSPRPARVAAARSCDECGRPPPLHVRRSAGWGAELRSNVACGSRPAANRSNGTMTVSLSGTVCIYVAGGGRRVMSRFESRNLK
mmetsp:Transcript_6289/g.16527  ORF Transcript_6289/g.16527 Transcript_6289/m.16527 type:complete len:273 (-) Transcript_6289:3-821(-)